MRTEVSLWLAIALLCAGLVVAGARIQAGTGGSLTYVLDDAYIHMAIAKNLALHGSFGINAGEFNAAASSLAWPIVIAAAYRVVGVNALIPLAVDAILAIALLFVLSRELRRFRSGIDPLPHFAALLAITFSAGIPRLVFGGMEHLFHIVVTIAFATRAARLLAEAEAGPRSRDVLFLALLASALTAARFEGAIAVGTVVLLCGVRGRIRSALAVGLAGALPPLCFAVVSLAHGAHLLPNSILIKGVATGAYFFRETLDSFGLELFRLLAKSRFLTALCLCTLLLHGLRRRAGKPFWEPGQLLLAIAASASVGHLLLVRADDRYVAYLIVLDLLALFATIPPFAPGSAWRRLAARPLLSLETVLLGLLLAVALGAAKRGYYGVAGLVPASVNIYEQQVQMGTFLRDFYPRGRVAANDIGAINFLADIECIDLWGLANEAVLRARLSGRYDTERIGQIVSARNGEIAIVYKPWFERFGGLPDSWTEVGEWSVAHRYAVANETVTFFATRPQESDRLARSLASFAPRLPRSVRQSGRYVEQVGLAVRSDLQ